MGGSGVKQKAAVHVVRKGDLAAGTTWDWEDPEHLATLRPQKRQALLDNPLSLDDQDPVQLLGVQAGVVVGRIDLFVGSFRARDGEVPTLWTSAYLVPEAYRDTLMSVALLLELHRLSSTVSACGVSQMALPVFRSLRWRDFELPRYLLVLRSRPVLDRYLGGARRSLAAAKVADTALAVQRAAWGASTRHRLKGLRCEPVDRLPAEMDALLGLGTSDRVAAHRSSAWVNWLMANEFGEVSPARKGVFLIRDNHEVVGYFLAKSRFYPVASERGFRDLTLASLQDWAIFDRRRLEIEQLLLLAGRALIGWHPDAIEVCTDDPRAGRYLRRWGWPRVGALHVLVRASPKSALHDRRLDDQSAWALRPADGDNFFS